MSLPFDLHVHTCFSDGASSPEEAVRDAKKAGVEFLAITDHDSVKGLPRAKAEGERLSLPVLPGVEFDTKFPCILHMLGLGVNTENPVFSAALLRAENARRERNGAIVERLRNLHMNIESYLPEDLGSISRLNIAIALQEAGYVKDRREAFLRFIGDGCPAYVVVQHKNTPEESIAVIHEAGGLAVLAHPCKLKADVAKTVRRLAEAGLDGIEVFYSTASEGQRREELSLAHELNLLVTTGSDYHGAHRPEATIGCGFTESPELEKTRERIRAML